MRRIVRKLFKIPRGLNDEEFKKLVIKRVVLTVFFLTLPIILIGSPFIIVEKVLNYNLTAADWLAFFGSYFGTLVGTLGVIITILFTNKEAQSDRVHADAQLAQQLRASKMPFIHISNYTRDNINDLGFIIVEGDNKNHFRKDLHKDIFISNLGDGHAVNFSLQSVELKSNSGNSIRTPEPSYSRDIFSVNETVQMMIHFPMIAPPIPSESLNMVLVISYQDIFNFYYEQSIEIEFPYGTSETDGRGIFETEYHNTIVQSAPRVTSGK